jgi:YD repeat-containing protein
MDASKQLTQDTLYGYDKNDNLTSIDHGGQTRAFRYDSLSRLILERTPEQDATINDGNGVFWSAKYAYTGFDALLTRQDARGGTLLTATMARTGLSTVSYNDGRQ